MLHWFYSRVAPFLPVSNSDRNMFMQKDQQYLQYFLSFYFLFLLSLCRTGFSSRRLMNQMRTVSWSSWFTDALFTIFLEPNLQNKSLSMRWSKRICECDYWISDLTWVTQQVFPCKTPAFWPSDERLSLSYNHFSFCLIFLLFLFCLLLMNGNPCKMTKGQ